jgi:KaiC/GvpD/RAD55 family RecA-like ATPase
LAVVRLEPKSFRQASPAPGGGWWLKRPPGPLPILNRPGIVGAELVVVCEGEKDCKALLGFGVIATTAPMGADSGQVPVEDDGKPALANWSPLAGKKVVLWGDDDEPGRRHLDRVSRILWRLHPRPTLLRVRREDLDRAKDAADLIAGTASEEAARIAIQRVIDNARPVRPAAALHARIEAAIAGKLVATPFPWASLGALTAALLPGAVTMLVGSPGSGKSYMLLQAALWWLDGGWRVALYELEEGQDFWLNRAMALLSGHSCTMDPAWAAAQPDEARSMLARHARELDRLAACLATAPAEGVTLEALAAWVEQQAAAGVRLILADPLTAAMEGADKPWHAAQRFMLRAKRAATAAGASLIFTTHGRKGDSRGGKGGPDLDSLAGGAAYARFSSTVLWLEAFAEYEDCTVIDADKAEIHAGINRRLRILKARNGRGTGMTIGLRFDGSTLRTGETGVIVTSSTQAARASRRIIASSGRDRAAGEG